MNQIYRSPNRQGALAVSTIALSFATLAVPSCGGSDGSNEPPPEEPVVLRITALMPRADQVWRVENDEGGRDPEPVLVGCDRRLGVEVELENWSLRAPGGCGALRQCGSLVATVTPAGGGPEARSEAALRRALVDLAPLGDALDGAHRVRVELRANSGNPFPGPDGAPLADEIEVELTGESCASGGSSGAGGQAGDAGESSGGASGGAS